MRESLFEDLLEPSHDHNLNKKCKNHHKCFCKSTYQKHTACCSSYHHVHCHHEHKECGTCEQAVNCFIFEAAHIENALADAILAESQLLKEGKTSPEKLEKLVKLVIKKEMVLEFLLEDILNACKEKKNNFNDLLD